MSNILTSGKDIQLHSFPSLNSKFSFKYVSEPRKFFIFPNDNIVVSMYRDNRIDLLHAFENHSGHEKIKRIKKLKLDGVTCAGVLSNDGKYEIAMGLTNGNIEFVDFNTKTMLEKKFSADKFGNGVENIVFNKDYDMLASTFQSGELQLFSMKSFRKLHRYRLDMKSDIVRFHPTNPHLLAVSSLGGTLTVLNVNLKRTVYSIGKAHKSYSADVSWLPSTPSTLLSVGGTTMKVFDTRQNVTLSVTDHAYTYSTLAISPCEKYCCVGDVKGSIMSYDLRNIRTALQTSSCHDGIVTNLRFLPCPLEAELSTDDIVPEEDSDLESIDRKKTGGKKRNSAQVFFDIVAPVKHQVDDSDDSANRKKFANRRTSAQDFFDIVAPVQQQKCSASEDIFARNSPETTKSVSNDLKSVPEENTTTDSSNSNNQTSMEEAVIPSATYLKNKRHTIGTLQLQARAPIGSDDVFSSITQDRTFHNNSNTIRSLQLQAREPLVSDDVFSSNTKHSSTPQHRIFSKNSIYKNSIESQNHYNVPSDMSLIEEKLQDMEIRMNEKLLGMQLKLEEKLNEKSEELNEVIVHGFRSIHCNLWTVAETDVRDTKNMVTTIHENYRQIADVFIENLRLKEQILQLQQRNGVGDLAMDAAMDADAAMDEVNG